MVKTGGHNYDALRRLCNQCVFPSRYTGKERDAESGLDYFGARYYASSMGRFMSPDWSAKAQPVPYAKLSNPQTLNLYGYMQNNPLGGVDQDGHCDWCQKLWNGITGNGFQTNAQIAATENAVSTGNDDSLYKVTTSSTFSLPQTTTPNLTLGPGMQSAINAEKFNGLVDLTASMTGLLSAVPGVPAQVGLPGGALSTAASVANDPSNGLNNGINATGQALAITSAVAEGTAVGTGASVAGFGLAAGATAWSFSNFTSNIITSVFAPPPEAMNINGTTVQQPDLSDIPQ
jgi:RHS repeat-associated protein